MDNLPWEFNFEEETQWEGDYFLDSFIEHLQRSMRIQCGEYNYRLKETETILRKAFGDDMEYNNFLQLQNELDFVLLKTVFIIGAKTGIKLVK